MKSRNEEDKAIVIYCYTKKEITKEWEKKVWEQEP
jgi:hypothetical protein